MECVDNQSEVGLIYALYYLPCGGASLICLLQAIASNATFSPRFAASATSQRISSSSRAAIHWLAVDAGVNNVLSPSATAVLGIINALLLALTCQGCHQNRAVADSRLMPDAVFPATERPL